MKVKFSNIQLDIERVRRIRTIRLQNHVESLKFHFPPGAIEIGTYYSEKKFFDSLDEFAIYVLAMPYMNFDCYQLPVDDMVFELVALEKSSTQKEVAGSFQSFLDFSRNTFLRFSLTDENLSLVFQLKTTGVGRTLFFESATDYICVYEQPID